MNQINLYDTRTMLESLTQMKPAKTFLLDKFFHFDNPQLHETEHVDIDIYKGPRLMARFTNPRMQGQLVEKRGFSTRSYKPGYLKPKSTIDAEDIFRRPIGGLIYQNNLSPQQRAQQKIGEVLADLREFIDRRIEWMAAQLLNTGKVTVSGEGIEPFDIDFLMDPNHIVTLAGSDLFTNPDSDPTAFIRGIKRLIVKDSGITPDTIILGHDALDVFLANKKVKETLDNRRTALGQIVHEDKQDGSIFYGVIEGVSIYSYDEFYIPDGGGNELPMVQVDKMLIGSTRARTNVHFGAIKDLGSTGVTSHFPKTWEENDPSARFIMVQSAPIVALHQSDAFAVAKVV